MQDPKQGLNIFSLYQSLIITSDLNLLIYFTLSFYGALPLWKRGSGQSTPLKLLLQIKFQIQFLTP